MTIQDIIERYGPNVKVTWGENAPYHYEIIGPARDGLYPAYRSDDALVKLAMGTKGDQDGWIRYVEPKPTPKYAWMTPRNDGTCLGNLVYTTSPDDYHASFIRVPQLDLKEE